MSRTTDKSLARSVYKILSSDVNGSFVSSCIECQDKLDNLRPGTDIHLRDHARSCLTENLGWIDSAGQTGTRRISESAVIAQKPSTYKPVSTRISTISLPDTVTHDT
jgi:hypothetical protein